MEDFTRTMGLEVMFQHARHKGERERERKRKKNKKNNCNYIKEINGETENRIVIFISKLLPE